MPGASGRFVGEGFCAKEDRAVAAAKLAAVADLRKSRRCMWVGCREARRQMVGQELRLAGEMVAERTSQNAGVPRFARNDTCGSGVGGASYQTMSGEPFLR